jgi:hypothetical protein
MQELLQPLYIGQNTLPDLDPIISTDDPFTNAYGSLRLALVRKHYGLFMDEFLKTKVQIKPLTYDKINELISLYTNWRDDPEFMPMRCTWKDTEVVSADELNVNPEVYVNKLLDIGSRLPGGDLPTQYKGFIWRPSYRKTHSFHKSIKRGNDVYIEAVKDRLAPIVEKPPVNFFDPAYVGQRKRASKTSMFYLTGSIKFKDDNGRVTLPISDAWLNFGDYWNSFITNIRQQFGKCVYVRTWQSQKNGYPHFHALVYFCGREFTVVRWKGQDGKYSYRLPPNSNARKAIKSAWKMGNLDVVCVPDTHSAMKDLLKYITRDLEGGESDLTNTMVWYFGKQAYAFSKDFVKEIWGDEMDPNSLAEPTNYDLINTISSNSNSELVRIEVWPTMKAKLLGLSGDIKRLIDVEPPPIVTAILDKLTLECDVSSRKREDGVEIVIYKPRFEPQAFNYFEDPPPWPNGNKQRQMLIEGV